MRIKGILLLVLGVVLLVVGYLLSGGQNINAILGALGYAMGAASVVASLPFLFGKPYPTA